MGPRRGLKLWPLACCQAWVVLTIGAEKKLFSPRMKTKLRVYEGRQGRGVGTVCAIKFPVLTSSHLRNPVVTVVHPSKLPQIFS